MSENKDLERIKHFINNVCDPSDEREKEVLAAAERMAAEIKRLRKEIQDIYDNDAAFKKLTAAYDKISKSNAEYREEIARLKAELAKRPEVVRCVECKYKEWCRKSINKDSHGDMCPLSYCSAGVRRESEEKQ